MSIADNNIYPAQQPIQTVENEKWDKAYWIQNVRWVCSMYNQRVVPSYISTINGTIPDTGFNTRFVDLYIKYARYIFGWQVGSNYGLVAKDAKNNNTQIPLYKGRDINSLFNFFNGKFSNLIKPIPKVMQAGTIAGEALSRKNLKMNVMKKLVEAQDFIKDQQVLNGIEIKYGDDLDISSQQIQEGDFTTFKESSENTYLKIAKNFYISNNCYKKFKKGGEHCFIGGMAMAFVSERDGKVYMEIIPPEYSIVDRRKDDDQHEEDQFGGQVRPYSVSEIVSKWKLTKDEAEDLERVARDSNSQVIFTTGWANLNWYTSYSGVPRVWVAEKCQWQSITYVNGVPVACIREATLIGNKLLKDERILPNSVLDGRNKKRKKLGYRVCTPNVIMSTNMGVVGLVCEMQDIKDSIITMMLSNVARSGNGIYLDTSQLPDSMKAPEFLSQLKQYGVVAANRAEIDEAKIQNPLIEIITIPIDPQIHRLLEQVQYWDNAIANVINMPKAATQATAGYQPKDQIQNNTQLSDIGTQWLYDNLTSWIRDTIEYGASLAINLAKENGEDLSVLIGDSQAELLKQEEVQECYDSYYEMHIDFDNSLTEQIKNTLSQITVQEAGVNPDAKLEYISILRASTIDEVESLLKTNKRKRDEAKAIETKQAQEAAAANTERVSQAQEAIAKEQTDAKLQDTQMKIEGKQQEIILQAALEENNNEE